jgi:hypothetical protein
MTLRQKVAGCYRSCRLGNIEDAEDANWGTEWKRSSDKTEEMRVKRSWRGGCRHGSAIISARIIAIPYIYCILKSH